MHALDASSLPRHLDRLYRAAWALCGDREDAEDLVQETFARILARPRLLRGGQEMPYLMGAMHNTFRNRYRDAARRPAIAATLDDIVDEDRTPTTRPEWALEIKEVYATIAALPDRYRTAIVAVDVMGLSYREALNALKIPEATITTRLHRARRYLLARLSAPQGPAQEPRNLTRDSVPSRDSLLHTSHILERARNGLGT
ncbi:MAG TPA: sigma-70 family RNA polymerase sigma factor [Solirubrobacteraceae bacterium]|jgi:RNA polymerase sigma-70 factor (ECF subfamily)|nr:sigma-70 family RNA polymerase sigma factor [Solirubrobacteraceae bacterium]